MTFSSSWLMEVALTVVPTTARTAKKTSATGTVIHRDIFALRLTKTPPIDIFLWDLRLKALDQRYQSRY